MPRAPICHYPTILSLCQLALIPTSYPQRSTALGRIQIDIWVVTIITDLMIWTYWFPGQGEAHEGLGYMDNASGSQSLLQEPYEGRIGERQQRLQGSVYATMGLRVAQDLWGLYESSGNTGRAIPPTPPYECGLFDHGWPCPCEQTWFLLILKALILLSTKHLGKRQKRKIPIWAFGGLEMTGSRSTGSGCKGFWMCLRWFLEGIGLKMWFTNYGYRF